MGYRGKTNKKKKLFIAVTVADGDIPSPQSDDLDKAGFEALNWVEVKKCGTVTPFAADQSIGTFDPLDGPTMKDKGNVNPGDAEQQWARLLDTSDGSRDPGQKAIIAAGETDDYYAFKIEFADSPDASSYTNTIQYSRAIVPIVRTVDGAGEDFIQEMTTLGLVQVPLTYTPEAIS